MLVIDLISDNPKNKFAPYQRMANAIIDLTNKNGGCLPQDLLAVGFTKQETTDLWHMANAMANVELRLAKNETFPIFKREKRYGEKCLNVNF
ncbi:MAG: hypothetical protein WC521_02280 [Bdellovibrionales bacterium]